MNVKEFRENINNLDPKYDNCEVIMQKDAEGNGFSPLYGCDINAIYVADTTYSGEVLDSEWSHEDAAFESEAEWEKFKKEKPRCLILWPIN